MGFELMSNADKTNFNLKNGGKIYIFPLSDLHYGLTACNLEYFRYWETVFKNTRSRNKIIYLLGDLCDTQNLRVGTWEWSSSMDEQVSFLKRTLKPYRKYIRFMTRGNHSGRLKRDYNYDVGRQLSEDLGVRYEPVDFFDHFNVNGQPFTVYGKHGTRFSKSKRLAQRNFIQDMNGLRADLFLQGHNHYGCFFDDVVRVDTEDVERKYYAFTGHFVNYFNSYAREKGMTVSPECFVRLSLNSNLKVGADEYHIDQERPELLQQEKNRMMSNE